MIGDFKTWPIRKKVHYTAQCRFWEKKRLDIQAWQQTSPIFEMVQADRQQRDMGL